MREIIEKTWCFFSATVFPCYRLFVGMFVSGTLKRYNLSRRFYDYVWSVFTTTMNHPSR